ncbi:MAG: DUF2852 domain-containing protein [Reyranella sp.]|nr:DUF2852 domain-containing protein [Reyranella sp.]
MGLISKIDDIGRPAWIALVVLSFILFWPIGIALLVYLKWSGRMFCSKRYGHWNTPDGSTARAEFRDGKRRHRWGRDASSGNVAFDEYREETLRKLEEDQREFRDYLDKLRAAKDRAEFDQFMNDRHGRPPTVTEPPPAAPTA